MRVPRLVLVLSSGPTGAALSPYVSFSLGAHVLFLFLFALVPTFRSRKPPAPDALVAVLVPGPPGVSATLPSAPPRPAPSEPAAAKPTPPKPETRSLPLSNPKKEKIPDRPKREPGKQEPAPAPPAAPAAAGNAGGPSAAPGLPPGPAPAAGGGITSLDAGDVEFAWYRALVTSALKSRWMRPVIEGTSETIVASVSFAIERDGRIANVQLEQSSGVPVMDRSVLRAVMEASPLPPLPSSWRDGTLPARFEFRWSPGEPN